MLLFFTSIRFQNDSIHLGSNSDFQTVCLRISVHLFRRKKFYIRIFLFRFLGCTLINRLPHTSIFIIGDHQIMSLIACRMLPFSKLYSVQTFLKINPDTGKKKDAACQDAKNCQCKFLHSFHSFCLFLSDISVTYSTP